MEIQDHIGTVTKKGQVTIPLAIRQRLGVKPYDRVTFRIVEDRVELLPGHLSLEAAYGAVKPRKRPEDWKEVRRRARQERMLGRTKQVKLSSRRGQP